MLAPTLFVSLLTPDLLVDLQTVLSMWYLHNEQSFQYVCQLHTVPSRHHSSNTEAGQHFMVQGMQQIFTASQKLAASGTGIQRAFDVLRQTNQGVAEGVPADISNYVV